LALWAWCALVLFALPTYAVAEEVQEFKAAFGHVDISPDVNGPRPVWLAGYGYNRRATDVHDPLFARGVVLSDGRKKIALVSVDLVGLQYPAVVEIRKKLPGFAHVMVSSTHNHEGPDVIGLWGATPVTSGVDPDYVAQVVEKVAVLVRELDGRLAPAAAAYGTAEDETLLGDSRLPKVYDSVLRVLRFTSPDGATPLGILVQWNCHPESMGSKNTQLTADFPWATVAALQKKWGGEIAYFSGAVGGLMAPPDGRIRDAAGKVLEEGDFEYTRLYGEAVAELASQAIESASPIELAPFGVFSRPIAVPLDNVLYVAARTIGVLRREAYEWNGDPETFGKRLDAPREGVKLAVQSEVTYLQLGELHVACIPGELYPELVYGEFQEPAEEGADFKDAPLEEPVKRILPGEKTLLFGLASDELGYIIPKRQWDSLPPFAYGRKKSQYGEINSCGPDVAAIVMQALKRRVEER
jgi:hypothetical protein